MRRACASSVTGQPAGRESRAGSGHRAGIFAVYTFKLQRIRGIYVQTRGHVVATQLVIELTKHAVKPHQGSSEQNSPFADYSFIFAVISFFDTCGPCGSQPEDRRSTPDRRVKDRQVYGRQSVQGRSEPVGRCIHLPPARTRAVVSVLRLDNGRPRARTTGRRAISDFSTSPRCVARHHRRAASGS
jgi:hypothetical protein